MDELKHEADIVSKLSADRLSILEQAVPLAAHLSETHSDLLTWFDEIETDMKAPETPAINSEQIKEQQDVMKVGVSCNDRPSKYVSEVGGIFRVFFHMFF